jgi:hypothetical protein
MIMMGALLEVDPVVKPLFSYGIVEEGTVQQ